MITKKNTLSEIPEYPALVEATYKALKQLGGSGRNDEINKAVYSILNVSDAVLKIPHTERKSFCEIDYRLAWARTILKSCGAIENSARRVWSVTSEFSNVEAVDGNLIFSNYNNALRKPQKSIETDAEPSNPENAPAEAKTWRQRIYDILINMDPYAFERLTQRVLRECGFTDVTVTKRSGDGGIDGYGKLKINGVISFNIAFQCKRYQGSVGAPEIRDFRGSLTKNIEKGVFITTGSFSKAARDDAENMGKQQIDLIDGEDFIDMLAEYSIGLKEVKDYEIDEEYFAKI